MMLDLKLRKFRETDFEAFHAAHSDYDFVKMTSSWPWPPDPEFTKRRMATPEAKAGLALVIDLDGRFIGSVALVKGALAYGVLAAFRCQGVASWAARQKINFAFSESNIAMIQAGVWHQNYASMAVLKKLGFVETSKISEYCAARGKFLDGYTYELIRETWEKK